jgi:nitroreductase
LRNFQPFDAPHTLIIISPRELGDYGAIDCGLFIQVLLLAAESPGLGDC